MLAILALSVLYVALPERLTLGPTWVFVAVTLAGLAVTIASHKMGRHDLNRLFGVALLALITAGLMWALGSLIAGMPRKLDSPTNLLRSAVTLWASNILVFASWYWRLDAGGPHQREMRGEHRDGAFLFPQMTLPPSDDQSSPPWKPGFVDYLFLAFNTNTAFSPTDVPVLSHWAKVLMMVQSSISLATAAILAARAINIL